MNDQIPPSLERFREHLDHAAHRELGGSRRVRPRVTRPRVLAGGSLTLAGLAAVLVLVLGAAGSSPTPAYAITTNGDGSVLVNLANVEAVPAAEQQLADRTNGNEWFQIVIGNGPATSDGPVSCAAAPDATSTGPSVSVQLGTDGTSVVPAGEQGAGPWHLAGCTIHDGPFPGVGNTGGDTGNTGS